MSGFTPSLERLIEQFARLPSVGKKSAQRLAFHILNMSNEEAKKFTDGEVSINQYCYAGPKPQSKIAAIIMIADGSEAASRSLADRSKESVERVVHKLVNERMELGQFDECEITLKELNIIIHNQEIIIKSHIIYYF